MPLCSLLPNLLQSRHTALRLHQFQYVPASTSCFQELRPLRVLSTPEHFQFNGHTVLTQQYCLPFPSPLTDTVFRQTSEFVVVKLWGLMDTPVLKGHPASADRYL